MKKILLSMLLLSCTSNNDQFVKSNMDQNPLVEILLEDQDINHEEADFSYKNDIFTTDKSDLYIINQDDIKNFSYEGFFQSNEIQSNSNYQLSSRIMVNHNISQNQKYSLTSIITH
jgi:hypothetical protein